MKKHFPILLILTLALVLRLAGTQTRPIWYDEAFSILLAEKGPASILNGTLTKDPNSSAAEEHPPAYYFALWGWMQLFGTSLISARLLSILFSLGTIICIYKIAEHLFDHQTAFVAATLTAILPFQVHYGTEIRMYIMLAFWLMLATLAYLKRWWIVFSLSAALAQYTHNLAAIYLIPLALTPLFQRDWKTLRNLTLAGSASIILYLPWLLQLPAQVSKVTSNFWIEKPGFEKIFTLFLMYVPHLPLPNSLLPLGFLFATLVIAIAAFQTYLSKKYQLEAAKHGLWLAYLSFAPPILLWIISQIFPLYVERALLPSHAIFCIWLAWSLSQTKIPRPVQLFSFSLIITSVVLGVRQHLTYRGFPYIANPLVERLENLFEKDNVIIHSNKLSYLPAFYLAPALQQGFILDPANSSVDTLSPVTRGILNLTYFEDIQKGTQSANRVHYVVYKQSLEEFEHAGRTHPDIEYLNEHFTLETAEKWDDLMIYIYRKDGK